MAEDITVKVIAEAKSLQEQINRSSLSKEDKNVLSAKLSEALNLLGKGANASAKDLSIASGNIKGIIGELVKAAAGAKGVSKELQAAQKLLEKATEKRTNLEKERSNLQRTKINNAGNLRTSEANRLAVASNVSNDRGEVIKSFSALENAAKKGNEAAVNAITNINKQFEVYKNRLDQLNNVEIPQANQEVKAAAENITNLEQRSPEDSAAVKMQEFGNELQNLIDKLRIIQTETNSASDSTSADTGVNPNKSLEDINKATKDNTSSFGKAFKQFSIYAIALKTIKSAAREALSTIKELDKSLTEQAMVTGKTREQTYALLSSYQELATQTGSTTKEVANLATQFMRQGKTTEDALTLTQAAMDAAKVAGISSTDSVNYLTTALNGFQMSAQDALLVSDKFASIAANAATSYDEIATALSKVASQANLAGMSIDYTTALLAKGLETTREAPETMGTALKTIIARMRELSDYGETLGGDTDINNVESQLAYVGIALRDANGELRSTEDVLDDLGKKWDKLNSNQQAAVAKALAGTRQQSRLIAMMTDYERVIELQQISERSAGATLAQMATYLEGMDAAMNKVNVAWEQIVTSLTDNEVIINLVNMFAELLNGVGEFLSTTSGTVIAISTIATLGLSIVGNKMKEFMLAKQQNAIEQENLKQQRLQNIAAQKNVIKAKEKQVIDLKNLKTKAEATLLDENATEAQKAAAQQLLGTIDQQILDAEAQVEIEKNKLDLIQQQDTYLTNQESTIGRLQNSLSGLTAPLFLIITLWKTISGLITVVRTKQDAAHKKNMSDAIAENSVNATSAAGKIISNLGVWGIPIAIAVAAALGAVGLAISAGISSIGKNSTATAADEVNSLSNEIYKLETKARAIETVTSSYAELDNQIIKTQKDQEEMNELLDQAADKLDEEEQAAYKALTTNKQRIAYLQNIQEKASADANKQRQEQLNIINSLNASNKAKMLDPNATDSDILTAQSAIYSINNQRLYDYIDALGNAQEGVEQLAQSLIEELSPAEALAFANSPDQINKLVKTLNNLETTYTSLNGVDTTGVAGVLTSDDYSIIDKIDAYRQALSALSPELQENLKLIYSDLEVFSHFNESALEFIDTNSVSIENINSIAKAIQSIGYSADESADKIEQLFQSLQDGGDIQSAIYDVFGQVDNKTYTKLINAYSSAMGTGVLNMGQNIETLKNTINSFYEKAMEWNEMSDSEKTSFLTDNADLFKGPEGQQLLAAIESGDYNFIQNALGDNETLRKKVAQQIKAIDDEIAIENAKLESERDYVYISYLEKQKAFLEDTENLYAASLETRLEQEQKYLDEYSSYLEKQRDALKESLEKRKEAYSDYFESINQKASDEEFAEQESTLIANISKLATSGSANAINQQAKLEQELAQLEKERLEELRQRAQDAIVENIDKTIEDIDKKFDELLNSQQALLNAMNGDLENPGQFLSNMIGSKIMTEGLTDLQLTDYIKELQTTYGSLNQFAGVDWNSLGQVLNTLNLNINGTTINNLSAEEQQSIYAAIMAALQQVGLR